MPRKRRKVSLTDKSTDIPFPKVRVEWIDCVSDSGWATDKEFDKMKLAKPVNEGWLYSKDKESVKLFASYDKDDDGITFGDRTMIPRAWVKKIQMIGPLVFLFLLSSYLCIILLLFLCLLPRSLLKRMILFSKQPHVV